MKINWRIVMWVVAIMLLTIHLAHDEALPTQATVSCYDQYAKILNESLRDLESCIDNTNGTSIGNRLIVRAGCNARWVSNAIQGEAQYFSCLSLNPLLGR